MVWKKSGKSLEFCSQKSVRTLNVINDYCYEILVFSSYSEICGGIFSCKLLVYLLMALSCLSLFSCVYPWSLFNFTFILSAIST